MENSSFEKQIKKKLSSGNPDLDIILEGGYSVASNVMISGPTGNEKNTIAYHFISAMEKDEIGIIICGNSSAKDIIEKAELSGVNLNKKDIYFIDCYSNTIGKKVEETANMRVLGGPGALNDLSLTINEIMKANAGKRTRLIYNTLSSFVIYNPSDSVRKFLSFVGGRTKTAGGTTIFLVDEGVHDKQLSSLLEQGMDMVIDIVEKEGKMTLQIPGIEIPVPFKVGPGGLTIV